MGIVLAKMFFSHNSVIFCSRKKINTSDTIKKIVPCEMKFYSKIIFFIKDSFICHFWGVHQKKKFKLKMTELWQKKYHNFQKGAVLIYPNL